MRKYWKRILLRFDRSFSTNRVWKPLLWVVGFCLVWTLLLWIVWLVMKPCVTGCSSGGGDLTYVIQLMSGSTNYPLKDSGMPYWYQLLIAFVGTMFFTAFLISTLSNILTNRAASHRKGFLRYWFSDHVLILGGSKVAVGILRSIAADAQQRKKEVVILTNQDAEELWAHIKPLLTEKEQKVKLTIYHGERNMDKELLNSQVDRASVIYIIGEDKESEHDSINVDCWKRVRKHRKCASAMAQCYLLLERNASTYVFNALPREDTKTLETTIVNRLDSVAQQVLIGDDKRPEVYTIDRGRVVERSKMYVHLVVAGMTQMGYAMATTAAHLCHYPNFDEKTGKCRTKITFIDPNAEEEMKMFKGRYPGLFELSHSWFLRDSSDLSNRDNQNKLNDGFGDFLDVEWEFVKGSVVDDWVRKMLLEWKDDKEQILTLAFCGEDAERNMAQALYLPQAFFRHVDESRPLTDRDPLIWVYQPENSALADTAHEQVGRYMNLLPFGTMTGSFDSRMGKRLAASKRINYLYQNKVFEKMGEPEVLDRLWRGLSYAEKMSNIYAANSIYGKYRSMGIKEGESVPDAAVDILARMEHARWNMEKLLVGFSALPKEKRDELNTKLNNNDPNVKEEIKRLKNEDFKHKDIAPYDELRDESKEYDKAIVRNLAVVIKDL